MKAIDSHRGWCCWLALLIVIDQANATCTAIDQTFSKFGNRRGGSLLLGSGLTVNDSLLLSCCESFWKIRFFGRKKDWFCGSIWERHGHEMLRTSPLHRSAIIRVAGL